MIVFIVVFAIVFFVSPSIVGFIGGFVTILLNWGMNYDEFLNKGDIFAEALADSPVYYLSLVLICMIVLARYEYVCQATPGKKLLGLRIVTLEGQRPNLFVLVLRNLLKLISIFFLGFGYLVCFTNERRQAWHDKVTKTTVVYEEFLATRRRLHNE